MRGGRHRPVSRGAVTRHQVLPPNPDTRFCRPISIRRLGRAARKEYKWQQLRPGTVSARNAHATSHPCARTSGNSPAGRTRSKRGLDCPFLGPRRPHRATAFATAPQPRPQRTRHFVLRPTASASVPDLHRGGHPIAPPAPHLGRGLGARAVAPALSQGPPPGRTHAAALVPARGADPGTQRPPDGSKFLLPRATAPRGLANGCGRSSRVAQRHTGLLAADRG